MDSNNLADLVFSQDNKVCDKSIKRAYVETSLDNLSYSSSTSSLVEQEQQLSSPLLQGKHLINNLYQNNSNIN